MPRPTLHLMCGLPGSGKTTLARKLEVQLPALRLCPDEWMERILQTGRNDAAREGVEGVQLDLAVRVLQLGCDVILEAGFWSRTERDRARAAAYTASADVKLHFLDVPLDELLRRVSSRNQALPADTFSATEDEMRAWAKLFERPDADELV